MNSADGAAKGLTKRLKVLGILVVEGLWAFEPWGYTRKLSGNRWYYY